MQTLERNRLIAEYLPYTGAIATAFLSELDLHGVVNYEDVLGYAHVGLTQAADRFRPECGAHFKTFSFPRIRGAVIEGLRACHRGRSHHQRWRLSAGKRDDRTSPLPQRLGWNGLAEDQVSQSVSFEGEPAVDPFEALDRRFLRDDIRRALETLPELERQIIALYYFADLNHRHIGQRLGHTASYIGRRRLAALRSLAKALRTTAEDFHVAGGQ